MPPKKKATSWRDWFLTWHIPEEIVPKFVPDEMVYMVYQREKGEKKGGEHWQMYVRYFATVGATRVQKHFPGSYHAPRAGTPEECRNYCMKSPTRISEPVEHGRFAKGQGDRTDLTEACELARAGRLREVNLTVVAKYHKGLDRIQRLHFRATPIQRNVYIIWGGTGCGKSYKAHSLASQISDRICEISWDAGWADPYEDEKVVIFDEFKGYKMRATRFLELIGDTPTTVNVKGATKHWLATDIFITSNDDPRQWWNDVPEVTMNAIRRRITGITHLTKVRPEVKIVSWDDIPTIKDQLDEADHETLILNSNPSPPLDVCLDDIYVRPLSDAELDSLLA